MAGFEDSHWFSKLFSLLVFSLFFQYFAALIA